MSQPWPWARDQGKGFQRCGPRVSSWVTFHALGSVGEREGMNPHIPKWVPTLGIRVPNDSRIFRGWMQGQNSLDWKVLYIIENILEHKCLKWACMTHLGPSNINYGKKKGWKSNWQFDSWPLKVGNLPDFLISLHTGGVPHTIGNSQRGLQLCFRPQLHQRFTQKVMGPQSCESPNFGNFGTSTWESQDKMTFGCWPYG